MKRVAWITCMVVAVLGVTLTSPRPAVAASLQCGEHCVTNGFCDAWCWNCKESTPFEKTCQA